MQRINGVIMLTLPRSGDVNFMDYAILASHWLWEQDPNLVSNLTPKLNGTNENVLEGKYLAGFQQDAAKKFYAKYSPSYKKMLEGKAGKADNRDIYATKQGKLEAVNLGGTATYFSR